MHMLWKGTREEFEREHNWRATFRREGKIYFILEGNGSNNAREFYEYPEGEYVQRYSGMEPKPVNIEKLKYLEEIEVITVLAGKIPEMKGAAPGPPTPAWR